MIEIMRYNYNTSNIKMTILKAHNSYILAHDKTMRTGKYKEKKKAYRVLRFGIWVNVEGMGPVN